MPEISRPKISHKRGNYPTRKTLDGIAMSLMGTVPVIYNGDSPRDLRDLRGTVPVISPVIYFRDFWSSPHHLFPGTVPVIFPSFRGQSPSFWGQSPPFPVISGTVPVIFPIRMTVARTSPINHLYHTYLEISSSGTLGTMGVTVL